MKVFISHNSNDKPFVRKLANHLSQHGIDSWIDEAEIHHGESLIHKIADAIQKLDIILAIISKNSVDSAWVKKELSLAMTKEIHIGHIVLIPVVIDKCDIPFFLRDKLYADFTNTNGIEACIKKLISSIRYHQNRGPVEQDIVPGESIVLNYKPTYPSFVISAILILFSLVIMGATWAYRFSGRVWPTYDVFQSKVFTFSFLLIALQGVDILATLLKRSTMRTDPNFANDLNGLVVTGILLPRYRKVIKKYWRSKLVKMIVFCEIAELICFPPMILLVIEIALEIMTKK